MIRNQSIPICNKEPKTPVILSMKEQQKQSQAGKVAYYERPGNRYWGVTTELAVLQQHHRLEPCIGDKIGAQHRPAAVSYLEAERAS